MTRLMLPATFALSLVVLLDTAGASAESAATSFGRATWSDASRLERDLLDARGPLTSAALREACGHVVFGNWPSTAAARLPGEPAGWGRLAIGNVLPPQQMTALLPRIELARRTRQGIITPGTEPRF